MTWLIWVTLLMVGVTVEQKSQRSILLERACAKRPELDFCGPSSPAVVATSVVPLVIPPAPTTTPSTTTTTTTTEAPSTTPSTSSKNTTESVDFDEELDGGNSTTSEPHERLGSLVKLPKPEKSSTEKVIDAVIEKSGVANTGEPLKNTTVAPVEIEDEKGVLVFVSEFCVVERERFIQRCHGDIEKKEVEFCATYIPACTSTTGVLPVMTYCSRYYKYYPPYCKAQLVDPKALQFCFAFEQFCLPEKAAARSQAAQKPKSSLRKCEDVLPEARKVCNPFPNPKDTFNLVRCTQFITNCKRFVDWL
ncbi:hypothetical protein CAEBREN_10747 [Caenorhabditis brenneri]|uniref:Uncharacterized protein n=1 Tax=Caenorhabditis brenneri TaxID=135651 RepID=G0NND3_CAEBE|nr:hypothetical protein CAEBREN_10747 [Caenorhabditis brenneri]